MTKTIKELRRELANYFRIARTEGILYSHLPDLYLEDADEVLSTEPIKSLLKKLEQTKEIK